MEREGCRFDPENLAGIVPQNAIREIQDYLEQLATPTSDCPPEEADRRARQLSDVLKRFSDELPAGSAVPLGKPPSTIYSNTHFASWLQRAAKLAQAEGQGRLASGLAGLAVIIQCIARIAGERKGDKPAEVEQIYGKGRSI